MTDLDDRIGVGGVIVFGKGEVGEAIGTLIHDSQYLDTLFFYDPNIEGHSFLMDKSYFKKFPAKVIHICYPQHDIESFVKSTSKYISRTKTKVCLIHSTVNIGVCENIQNLNKSTTVIHCPVRGRHNNLNVDISKFPFYMGLADPKRFEKIPDEAMRYFNRVFKRYSFFKSAKETALAKLLSVVWYGMNITFTQEAYLICQERGIDFSDAYTRYFGTDTINSQYFYDRVLNECVPMDRTLPRPIFYPGVIGGKCVIQDVKLLKKHAHNYAWLNWIINLNNEMKNLRRKKL